jgi:predicted 3-demethylubiquinone-9 3-methyltransferase (glyoxalase superfamily)
MGKGVGGQRRDQTRKSPGSVMTVSFELDGQAFTALNGGPVFKFNEAISFRISCEDAGGGGRYLTSPGRRPGAA